MLKKTITYTDFDGLERTEDFYFNFTKAELAEMELSAKGGMKKMMERIVQEMDGAKLVSLFKEIILGAYGVKSEDGRRFIKSDELRESFSQTEAYSMLFMELSQNAEFAALFMAGIVPQDLAQ